jgi:two-component sensor histidine kinase
MMTLQQRLYILVLVSVLPALAIQLYDSIVSYREREAQVHQEVLRLAEYVSGELDRIIEANRAVLVAISQAPSVRAQIEPTCSAYIRAVNKKYPAFVGFSVEDKSGRVRCFSGLPSADLAWPQLTDLSESSFFKEAKASGDFTVSPVVTFYGTNKPVLPLSLPYSDKAGKFAGVISSAIDLEWLNNYFASKPLPPGGVISVADRNGTVLLRVPFLTNTVGRTKVRDDQRWIMTAPRPGTTEATGRDGKERIFGFIPLTATSKGLLVAVGAGKDAALVATRGAAVRDLALLLLTLCLALLAAAAGGRVFIQQPVADLTKTAHRWRDGKFTTRAAVPDQKSEIGQLAVTFNRMAEALEIREQELMMASERRDDAVRHQQLLINELNHRVKNTLATVQAIAQQTLQGDSSSKEVAQTFTDRIIALGRAHDVLTKENWAGADISNIVQMIVGAHCGSGSRRLRALGPEVRLNPKQALALSMAFHELCTNALKYGALSNGIGFIDIRWSIETGKEEAFLLINWQEGDGPATHPPKRRGFGMLLVQEALAQDLGGAVSIDFRPGGIVCTIRALLPWRQHIESNSKIALAR